MILSTFSFSAVFSRDMDGEIGKDVDEDKFNVDIDAAVAWLNLLSWNDYVETGDGGKVSVAPPVLWLYLKNNNIGYNRQAIKSLGERATGFTAY